MPLRARSTVPITNSDLKLLRFGDRATVVPCIVARTITIEDWGRYRQVVQRRLSPVRYAYAPPGITRSMRGYAVGHYPMLEKPDELNRMLRNTLKEFATKT